MKPVYARILIVLVWLVLLGGWITIVYVAGDPGTGLGRSWFGLAMSHAAVTYLLLLACYVLGNCSAWKQRLARASLNVAATMMAVVLIELPAAMGWVDYRVMLIPSLMGASGPHNEQFDRDVVYRRPSHDHFVERQVGDLVVPLAIPTHRRYSLEYVGDANGYRNAVDYGQADLILLGDSFIEGYHMPQSDTISMQLAQGLHRDVCNLALSDYGPCEELKTLHKFGIKLHPRVVVWFFYEGNDLNGIDEYHAITDNWDRHLERKQSFRGRSFFLHATSSIEFWLNQLRWRESELARRCKGRLRPEIPGGTEFMYFSSEPPIALAGHVLLQLDALHGILREAKAVCDAAIAGFLVVYVPRKDRVYRDLCTFSDDSDVPQWKSSDLPQQLGSWCKQTGIAYLDLTAPLQEAARQGKLVYLVDDDHWTAEGHTVAANEVARFIQGTSWLKARNGTGK